MTSFRIATLFLALISPLTAQAAHRRHHRPILHHDTTGIRDLVTRVAAEEGVPAILAHGVIRVESGYRCNAHNPSGASGIAQVMPRTAASVGVFGNLHDCATGLRAGLRYLHLAYERSRGNLCAAASMYASGLMGSSACTSYGRRVMYGRYGAKQGELITASFRKGSRWR